MDSGQFIGRIQKVSKENLQFGYVGAIAEFKGFCCGITLGINEESNHIVAATFVGVSNLYN